MADLDFTFRGRGARHFTAVVAGHHAALEYFVDSGTRPWGWFVQKPDGTISSRGRAESRAQAATAAISVAIDEVGQRGHLSEEERRTLEAKASSNLVFEQ
jgi:hypothetical protein